MKTLFLAVCIAVVWAGNVQAQSVDEYVLASEKLAKARKFADAAAAMTPAVEIQSENPDLYLKRANYYRLANDLAKVRTDVARAWSLAPNEAVLRRSERLLDTGDRGDCETVLKFSDAFIAANSQSDAGYETRSRARNCLGDMSGAFNDISMAVELAPENKTHRMNRANTLSRLGDSTQALDAYQQMIDILTKKISAEALPQKAKDLKRELAIIHTGRSKLFERKGDDARALADWSRAIDLMPSDTFHHQRAMYYRRLNRFDEAIADYTRAIEIEKKDDYIFLVGRAGVYASAGYYRAAILDYEESLKLRPETRPRIEPLLESVRKLLADQKK